ncbi:uncharacterized protein LOC108950055 [Ciona intestinalis]
MDKIAFLAFVFCIQFALAASRRGGNYCPSRCICKLKQSIVYVGCSRRGYEIMPDQIPPNVTDLNFQLNSLKNLTSAALSRFNRLEHAIFDNNQINYIEPNAFYGLVRLTRLDLSGNELKTFPWHSLFRLPSLLLLNLDHNQLETLPSDNRTLARLNDLKSLSLYSNSFTCSCKLVLFSKWLFARPMENSVNIPKSDELECSSKLAWLRYALQELFQISTKQATCQIPSLELRANFMNTSVTLNRRSVFNATVELGEYVSLACEHSSSENGTISKSVFLQFHQNDDVQISHLNIANVTWTNESTYSITGIEPGHHKSIFLCATESYSGTVVKGIQLFITELLRPPTPSQESRKIGEMVKLKNSMKNITATQQTRLQSVTPNSTLAHSEISRCGETPGVPIVFLKPTNTSPVTYKFQMGDRFGTLMQNKARGTIDVSLNEAAILRDSLYICHTHGPRILHRWSYISDSNTEVTIQVQSSSAVFIVCLSLGSQSEEVCGNFTVVPNRGGNIMVMVIVGAALMGFGTIPLLVAASQHAWHSRQEIAAARYRRTKPLLAKPLKHQLSKQASSEKRSKGIDFDDDRRVTEDRSLTKLSPAPLRHFSGPKLIKSQSNADQTRSKTRIGLTAKSACSFHSEIHQASEKEAMLAAPEDTGRNEGVQRWLNQVELENWSEASQRDAYVADGHSVTGEFFDDRLNEV